MKNLTVLIAALFISLGIVAQSNSTSTGMNQTTGTKMKADHYWMKDGKMWCTKNGKTMEMTKDMTLANGTVIMKDGTVKKADGTTMTLKNGERVDANGNMMPKRMQGQSTTK